ncbi:patatin-like phospholipase family protein [Isoalcanivorax indicus]|uniref:patatin-like phospholipase family protein n=1 Tax=Isoalcanivorax indicus TaxID=2202653 RepID=UPI0013C43B14|nr:patatin-like phospholipase family protein [Isoalcanivorax indicus]
MRRKRVGGVVLAAIVLAGGLAWSPGKVQAEQDGAERVALVLSGGGARGLAHVGVMRALEEYGVQVDLIVGTSMGAIVGALRASGLDAEALERVARGTDWGLAFTDRSPRQDQPYIFRQLDAGLAADYRLHMARGRIVLPRSVLKGQHMTAMLDDLFVAVDRVDDFDALSIPFRAVAADLVSGEQVVLDGGRLSTAVRASMSIPGLLEPVDLDGRLLVDGGVVNNIPVDVARDLGATRLVVVDVGTPRRKREDIQSLVDVMDQLTGLMVRGNSDQQLASLAAHDLLIRPQLESVSNSSFGEVDAALEAGYHAAVAALQAQGRVPVPVPVGDRPVAPGEPPVIHFIRVNNDSPVDDRVIRNLLRQPLHQPLDRARLHEDISAIYGLDYFRQIRYRVIEENGQTGLLLVSQRRQEGSNFLRVGLRISDDFRGDSEFGVGASLRMAGLNRLGGTAFLRSDIGTTPRLEGRFVQPLDYHMRYFIEPQLLYQAERIDLFDDTIQDEAIASYQRRERQAGLALGRQLYRQRGEVRVGVVRKRGDVALRGGMDLGEGSYDDGYYLVGLGWDTLDDLAFPRRGLRWKSQWQWHDPELRAEQRFRRFSGEATWALSTGRVSWLLEGDLSVSDTDEQDLANIVPIGGFLELSGLAPRSRWGMHRAMTRLVTLVPLGPQSSMPSRLPLFAGASLERGNVWEIRSEMSARNAITAGSAFLGMDTPVGPAYLSLGLAEGGHRSVNLFVGQLFR